MARINPIYFDEKAEKFHPIKDRCWASHISAAGGALSVAAAYNIKKKRYGRAAAYSAASAGADFIDGIEARRYAKRHPEEARARQNRGAIEDQGWDKFRNILLGLTVMSIEKLPSRVKTAVGALVLKESVTLVAGTKAIIDHKIQNDGGWPAPLPSSPIGKESMWWIGGGLSTSILAAKVEESSPELSNQLDNTASVLCAIGFARGLQTVPEYLRANKEMSSMTLSEQMNYKPDFYTPHVGTYAINAIRYIQNLANDARGAEAPQQGQVIEVVF